jgi:hypothetical protein
LVSAVGKWRTSRTAALSTASTRETKIEKLGRSNLKARRNGPPQLGEESGWFMKCLHFCKLPLVLVALGGTLILAPGARAQSDVAPDHFDRTDSWAAAASVKAPVAKPAPHAAVAKQQVGNSHSATPALKPVAAHELTASKKQKVAARKSTNQSN